MSAADGDASSPLVSARVDGFLAPNFLISKHFMTYSGPFVTKAAFESLKKYTDARGCDLLSQWLPRTSVRDQQSRHTGDALRLRVLETPLRGLHLKGIELHMGDSLLFQSKLEQDRIKEQIHVLYTSPQSSSLFV